MAWLACWFARPKTVTHLSICRGGPELNLRPPSQKSSAITTGPASHQLLHVTYDASSESKPRDSWDLRAARSYTRDVEPNNVETRTGNPKQLAIKRQQNERCHKRRISCITNTSHHLRGPLARCTQYVRYESNSCSELMTSFRVFTIIRPDVTPDGFRGCVQAVTASVTSIVLLPSPL